MQAVAAVAAKASLCNRTTNPFYFPENLLIGTNGDNCCLLLLHQCHIARIAHATRGRGRGKVQVDGVAGSCKCTGSIYTIRANSRANGDAVGATDSAIYGAYDRSVGIIEVRDVNSISAIGSILGHCTYPCRSADYGRNAVRPCTIVSADTGVRPSGLAGITGIAGRAYTDVVCTRTPVLTGGATTFVFATGIYHASKRE